MKRLFYFIEKEFIQVLRDRKTRLIVFIAPLIQLVVYGYVISTDVRNVRIGVVDYSGKKISRDFITSLCASGFFKLKKYYSEIKEMEEDFIKGEIDLGIIIKEDFERRIKSFEKPEILALFDGSRGWTTQIVLGYFSKYLIEKFGTIKGNLKVTVLYNAEGKTSNFMIPAVIAMVLLVTGMILTSISVAREKETETIELLSISPISHFEFVLGKTIPYATIGFIDLLFIILLSLTVFKVPFKGNVLLLLLGSVFFLFLVLGIGLLSSIISETQAQAMITCIFFVLPMLILSGFFYPVESMPLFFKFIAQLNPLTHFLVILRSIFLKGSSFYDLFYNFFMLSILSLLVFTFSFIKSKKLLEGK
ncbi:MAG: ABC transporter permease [Candidatus Hydrothermales bacterium]